MSNFYGELLIRITSDTAGLSKGLAQAGAQTNAASKAMEAAGRKAKISWERVGLGMQNVGRTMTQFVTLPVAAGFAFAAYSGYKYSKTLLQIRNLTGLTATQTERYGEAMLNMGKYGIGPQKLAESMYFISSSGFEAAEALKVLDVVAKASASGMGDIEVMADVVTSALNSYGHAAYSAAEVTDILMKTVEVGKAEPEQLASSLGRILPIAKQLGIGFEELGGNVAALTLGGLSAAESVTALRGTMVALVSPAKMSIKELKSLGLSYQGVTKSIAEDGLLPTLKMLWEATDHNMLSMRKIIPNVRATSGVMSLLGANYKKNLDVIDQVSNAQGKLNETFETTSQTPIQRFRQAIASIQASLIRMGIQIMPTVADIVSKIGELFDAIGNMSPSTRSFLLWSAAVVAALGPITMVAGSVIRSIALVKGAFLSLGALGGAAGGAGAAGTGMGLVALEAALAGIASGIAVVGLSAAIATAVTLAVDAGMKQAKENAETRAKTGDGWGWKDLWSEVKAAFLAPGDWFSEVTGNSEFMALNKVIRLAKVSLDEFAASGGKAGIMAKYLRQDLSALWENPDILGDLRVPKTVKQMKEWRSAIVDNLKVTKKEAEAVLRTMFGPGVKFTRNATKKMERSVKGLQDRIAKLKDEQFRATVFGDFLGAEKAGKQIDALTRKLERIQTMDLRKKLASRANTMSLPIPDWTKAGSNLRIPVPQWKGTMKFPKIDVGGAKVALQGITKYLDSVVKTRKITITAKITTVQDAIKGMQARLKEIGDKPTTAKLKAEKEALEKAVKDAKKKLENLKSQKTDPKITANNTQALTAIGQVKLALASLPKSTHLTITETTYTKEVPRAKGGVDIVTGPTRYLAGEEAPEIAAFFPMNDPARSSQLFLQLQRQLFGGSSSASQAVGNRTMGGGGVPIVNVYLDSEPIAAAIEVLDGAQGRRINRGLA